MHIRKLDLLQNIINCEIKKTLILINFIVQRRICATQSCENVTIGLIWFDIIYKNLFLIFHMSKVSDVIKGIIFKLSSFMPVTAIRHIYYALFYSRLSYCISVWGGSFVTNINKITNINRRAVNIFSDNIHPDIPRPRFAARLGSELGHHDQPGKIRGGQRVLLADRCGDFLHVRVGARVQCADWFLCRKDCKSKRH